MKHIFTVHSPITFLLAFLIVRHEKLNSRDVVIISANYKLPITFGNVIPAFSDVYKTWFSKIGSFNVGGAFDKYLNNIIGNERFYAYIDIMHNYQKLLVTHKQCEGFHFFEEGTDSYILAHTLKDFTRTAVSDNFRNTKLSDSIKEVIRTLRGYTSGFHSLPYHSQSYQYDRNRKYFCLSEFCYPGVPDYQKVVVKPLFFQEELAILSSNVKLINSIILVEETYPDNYGISDIEYKEMLSLSLDKLNNKRELRLYLKLRPAKNIQDSRLAHLLEELSVSYDVLPHGALAEGVFLNAKNLKVIGFVSSLLLYAQIFGHEAFSMLNRLESRPMSRFDSISGFKELVKDI
jgi:hypothetical protein